MTPDPDFHALFEAAPGSYLVLAPDAPRFTIVAVTNAYLNATFTKRDEILGRGLFDVFPKNPDAPGAKSTENLRCSLRRVIESGEPDTLQVRKYDIPDPDDGFKERYWTQMISPVLDADGALKWLVLWEEDVTDFVREKEKGRERKQVAEALRARAGKMEEELHRAKELEAANARLRRVQKEREELVTRLEAEKQWMSAVLDTSPIGLILFEPDGKMYFNGATKELFGMDLSPRGGSAQYAHKVFSADGTPLPPDQLPSFRALQRGETVVSGSFLLEPTHGKRMPVVCSAAPIRDAGGGIVGAVVTLQDVSETLRAEQRIRKKERLLSGLFEVLPVGIWLVNQQGETVRTNPAGRKMWAGARHDGLSEFSDYKAWWADTGEPVAEKDRALRRALTEGKTSLNELLRIQLADGGFKTIINTALPLKDEEGQPAGAMMVNQDVTEIKEAEQALRDAVHAREEILGIVAHDLRNPLSSILLQTEAIARRPDDEKRRDKSLEAIRRQVKRMHRLIQDLLDVSRVEKGTLSLDLKPVPPDALLAEVFEQQKLLASDASLRLRLDIREALPDVRADHHRLLQVFENLVGNALKFTGEGGRITIGAARREQDVLFWVSDTGEGIAEDSLSSLFNPFWQADPHDRRGVGLGLPIVKGIVEASDGRIWAESRVGRGTTFFFTLPAASGSDAGRGVEAHSS